MHGVFVDGIQHVAVLIKSGLSSLNNQVECLLRVYAELVHHTICGSDTFRDIVSEYILQRHGIFGYTGERRFIQIIGHLNNCGQFFLHIVEAFPIVGAIYIVHDVFQPFEILPGIAGSGAQHSHGGISLCGEVFNGAGAAAYGISGKVRKDIF